MPDEEGCRGGGVKMFKGNSSDPASVGPQAQKLQQNVNVRHVTVVDDRGLLTHALICNDRNPLGLSWLTTMRRSEIRKTVVSKGCCRTCLMKG